MKPDRIDIVIPIIIIIIIVTLLFVASEAVGMLIRLVSVLICFQHCANQRAHAESGPQVVAASARVP